MINRKEIRETIREVNWMGKGYYTAKSTSEIFFKPEDQNTKITNKEAALMISRNRLEIQVQVIRTLNKIRKMLKEGNTQEALEFIDDICPKSARSYQKSFKERYTK